ncbi:hypothetical protein [Streptomyces sp. GESEQ-35]|uniref:hypothetical protein n=1 Tax=Streptomyces sp. GESEQ-35 TaxID=2812657 RepID=UPI001B3323A1|nr:hypothetical protein [Streptomyces sp. GESEQ-35]
MRASAGVDAVVGCFDLLAEDVVFDYVISVPGYPRRVEGRRAVAELYRGYGSTMILRSALHPSSFRPLLRRHPV